jgi:hypothetical protein
MKPKIRKLNDETIKKLSEIRLEERIKNKNVIKTSNTVENDTKKTNLKSEFDLYLENLSDEEYQSIMGHARGQ